MNSSSDARLLRALDSLEGLSVGDAFGEQFFLSNSLALRILDSPELDITATSSEDEFILTELVDLRRIDYTDPVWKWTDDTALAVEIVAELRDNGQINPDSLAHRFSKRYISQPNRGYGGAMHTLLPQLRTQSWQVAAQSLFDGEGSYGNGSAMRVPPLGAYFADDFDLLVEQARLSAIVTHSHDEGIAGAIATAVATGIAARLREEEAEIEPPDFLNQIIQYTPASEVKNRLIECRDFPENYTNEQVASIVGSGLAVACQDTVPFCCWCAATPESVYFSEALWLTVAGLGDRDTTCAIVGGIVGARVGKDEIPDEWHARREPLPKF
ncbi:crystallin J1 [bacterium]|nr:MAG: crystallin J1 [bacterium]